MTLSTFSNGGWWNEHGVPLFFCPLCQCCPLYTGIDAEELLCFNAQRPRSKLPDRLHALPRLLTMKPSATAQLRKATRTSCCCTSRARATIMRVDLGRSSVQTTHASSRRHKPRQLSQHPKMQSSRSSVHSCVPYWHAITRSRCGVTRCGSA